MAATRLITMHQNKGKSVAKSLSDRTDYAKNGEKTEHGQYISSYACQAESVDEEFMLSKREYERLTGRHPRGNIIAYQIRQSFKPGEITPEEANQVGYETAMRFTKGNHAFIVATHTDKAHIHNHIIFNSTSLDCTHKFRDFFFVGLALQRLSDIICLEHGLSVIEKKKPSERVKRTTYPEKKSFRDDIRDAIDQILKEDSAKDFDELLYKLEDAGYEIKRGKHISLKGKDQKRFIRLRSLGDGYTEDDLKKILAGEMEPDEGSYKWGVTTSQSYFPKDNTEIFATDDLIVDWLTQYSEIKDATYVRGFLGRMLFAGEDGVKKMRVLSGGEKVRVLLSRMMIMGSNVLMFDEPTDHLDMESITALNNGMIKFPGVILFSCRDHQVVQTTANRIIEILPNGAMIDKVSTYDEYLESDVMARKRQVYSMSEEDENDN